MTLATVRVEVGFVGGASTGTALQLDDASRGLVGTGTLGADDTWTDVTAWVSSWQTRRGSTRVSGPVVRYDPGVCTVVFDNADRRFDPTNLAGPYVFGGKSQVTPRRAMRITAQWGGVTYPVFRGFADSWDVEWFPGPARKSTTTLAATDGTKILANYDGMARGSPVGVGELSGARINRILDNAGWASADRVIAAGDSAMSGTTLAQAAWTDLLLTTDSELGELYFDASGRVVFRNRKAILTEPASTTSQATLSDADGAALPYEGLSISYDDEQIVNEALIGRVGGTQQIALDVASQQTYLKATKNRTDLLLMSDNESADYAGYLVHQGKEPELTFDQVSLWAVTLDGLWPHVLGREFGDRVTVVRSPPGGGTITRDCFIRGVSHQGSASDWRTQWTLQSATRYQFLVLDHPTQGVLDANALAY